MTEYVVEVVEVIKVVKELVLTRRIADKNFLCCNNIQICVEFCVKLSFSVWRNTISGDK